MWRLRTRAAGAARDRGAIAVMIAILLPLVLLGIGAVVVDVGSWYAERAQTQNGADAAAEAVAKSCAQGTCNTAVATTFATQNSNGNLADSTVSLICGNKGSAGGSSFPACPGTFNGSNCPANPTSASTTYVDVQVKTSSPVPAFFSRAFGKTGQTIAACAQAVWGPPGSLGSAVALTISACEWEKNTNGGTSFASIPSGGYGANSPYYTAPPSYLATLNTRRSDSDYDTTTGDNSTNWYVTNNLKDPHNPVLNAPIAGSETVITTHGFGNTCRQGNPGWQAPGQFGWLSHSTCTVSITDTTYTGATGNTPAPCGPIFQASLQNKTPVYIPVYTSWVLNGSNTTYTLEGFAAFVVTGWDVGGGVNQWNLNGSSVPTRWDSVVETADNAPNSSLSAANKARDAHYCNDFTVKTGSSDVCVYGYFTQALVPASAVPGGNGSGGGVNLGATAPYLTG